MKMDFARRQMVEQQVRAWDVLDSGTLEVLQDVPREHFVPRGFEALAFADTEIPIGRGETMMTPTIEGRLLQSLDLKPDDAVLEIGTGTGFLSACLSRLAGSVTSVDIHEEFLQRAAATLEEHAAGAVRLLQMDATQELPDASYDAIAVTGSVEAFDPRFVMALNPGGRLFIVVGTAPVMEALIIHRGSAAEWQSDTLFETSLRPLVHASRPPQFSF